MARWTALTLGVNRTFHKALDEVRVPYNLDAQRGEIGAIKRGVG